MGMTINKLTGLNIKDEVMVESGYEAVCGYVRVSTEGQSGDDKYGLDAQKKAIRDYCYRNRLYVKIWFIDVDSGVKEERDAISQLMYGDMTEYPKRIVAFKSDRIARDTKLYFYILYVLERRGLKLECVTEEFETEGEFANLYRSMLMFCAEQERKNIKLRTTAGKKIKRDRGGFVGGRTPYGYQTNAGDLQISRREAYIVQFIFYSYYDKHESGLGIAKKLNKRRIPCKSGKEWYASTIKSILNNKRFYQGYILNSEGVEIKGLHKPILKDLPPDENKGLVIGRDILFKDIEEGEVANELTPLDLKVNHEFRDETEKNRMWRNELTKEGRDFSAEAAERYKKRQAKELEGMYGKEIEDVWAKE